MTLMYPVNYIAVTQFFNQGVHNGMDLGWSSSFGGMNQPILAPADGVVVGVRKDYNQTDSSGSSYGNYVKIKHNEEFSTLCAHMEYGSVTLNVGDTVKRGDQIGRMGNTGYSLGNHVHYEVFLNNTKVNPILYSYVFNSQIVSPQSSSYLMYYEDPKEDIEALKKLIQELEIKNAELNSQVLILTKELEEANNYVFTYPINKTAYYKIKLYDKEALCIKNVIGT